MTDQLPPSEIARYGRRMVAALSEAGWPPVDVADHPEIGSLPGQAAWVRPFPPRAVWDKAREVCQLPEDGLFGFDEVEAALDDKWLICFAILVDCDDLDESLAHGCLQQRA